MLIFLAALSCSEHLFQSVSHRFGIEGNVDGGRAQALREDPHIRQAIIQHFEQTDAALAQRLTENPGLFDSQIHIIPVKLSDAESQAFQTVCPQFISLPTGF